jgi:hypothetical protein
MLLIFYSMMMIPFRMSFEDSGDEWLVFDDIDLVFDFMFLTDILITFNTAIYCKG